MNIRWTVFLYLLRTVVAQDTNCDFYQRVAAGVSYIESPQYPNSYPRGVQCRWIADCPAGFNCRLNCPNIALPESTGCMLDRLLISKSGDYTLTGADTYCGRGSLTAVSSGQRMSIGLITSSSTAGGSFQCKITTQPITTNPQSCSCGVHRQNRIVGGTETGINEYPMMAALVDVQTTTVTCGAVIISNRYVLTAAHCLLSLRMDQTAVVVGEHDINRGESNATRAYRVQQFTPHPLFNESNYDYDIALVAVREPIKFSPLVGPVCLPFKFVTTDFTRSKVTILGWGTTFPGGPTSSVLLKADVDVSSQTECRFMEPKLTPRQICYYTAGKDACQYDSGGPVLYTDPSNGLLYNIGITSYGRYCASKSPAINTRVPVLLDWIITNAPDAYCRK